MCTYNDATAALRVCLVRKPAAPNIISRKINRADREGGSSSASGENFDHLIPMSVDYGECQRPKLGQDRQSVAVDTGRPGVSLMNGRYNPETGHTDPTCTK
jgi:hypothetical protein